MQLSMYIYLYVYTYQFYASEMFFAYDSDND